MTRSRFPQTSSSSPKKSSGKPSGSISIVQLVLFCLGITILAAIFIQNLQPAIQIFFFGQKTLPIPLSVSMLAAFGAGVFLAIVFNAIASWRQNAAIRRAVVTAKSGGERTSSNSENYETEDYDDEDDLDNEDFDEEVEDPDTVPYGDRTNLKSQSNTQTKRDRPPLDAKYIE